MLRRSSKELSLIGIKRRRKVAEVTKIGVGDITHNVKRHKSTIMALNVISIVWFRQDLRLADNPAVFEASKLGKVFPIYILDDCAPEPFKLGGATKVWLNHSLNSLNKSLDGNLNVYVGKASEVIQAIIENNKISNVFWNRCFEPWHIQQEDEVETICEQFSINNKAFNSNYLYKPHQVLKDDGSFYKVFTPYKKKSCRSSHRQPITMQNSAIKCIVDHDNQESITGLNLIPWNKNWPDKILKHCKIGETAAQTKLENFINHKLSGYKKNRNFPPKNHTSLLSPHLHFGEISPAQIFKAVMDKGRAIAANDDIEHFISEVKWREFSCYLLYHFNKLHEENFKSKFNKFPWREDPKQLKAWQMGKTGIPIVDAGMRQLWETGYMHNRVRMITASFLVKNLTIHWHKGRDWFWDCLVDADLANNSASWQWVAGSGADAAPYFRIFNPVLQGEKFDKDGSYTRKYVPELRLLPDKYLFKPWTAPKHILKSANVVLGETYPHPIVDLKASREYALESYKVIKGIPSS